jgi:hypothetical protein
MSKAIRSTISTGLVAILVLSLQLPSSWAAQKQPMSIDAVAPGQVVPGASVRIYGRAFRPGKKLTIAFAQDPATEARTFTLPVGPAHSVDLKLPTDLEPGLYSVAVLKHSSKRASVWRDLIEVVPARINAPDPAAMRLPPRAVAFATPVVPGQVVTGRWSGYGEIHYFLLRTGAGAAFDLSLKRTERDLSAFHPDSADPDLFIARPSGWADRGPGKAGHPFDEDSDAYIDGWVSAHDGVHLICCRNKKGQGGYELSVKLVRGAAGDSFTIADLETPPLTIIGGSGGQHRFQSLVLDPRGIPAAGVLLEWQVDGGDVAIGGNEPSRADGTATVYLRLGQGNLMEATPSFPWPWNDPEVSGAEPYRCRFVNNVGTFSFDPVSGVVHKANLQGR